MCCRFNICAMFIFFLTGIAYSQVNKVNDTHVSANNMLSSQANMNKKQAGLTSDDTNHLFNLFSIKKDNFYLVGGPLYGSISDGGASGLSIVETFSPTGEYENNISRADPGFGFIVTAGYRVNPSEHKDIFLTYTRMHTEGNVSTGVASGGFLYNDLTQFGNADIPGFYVVSGPASANTQIKLGLDSVDMLFKYPWTDAQVWRIDFVKLVGLKFIAITKQLQGTYRGLVTTAAGGNTRVSSQDEINYSANFYGLGVEVGFGATWSLSQRIKIQGDGIASFLAGLSRSRLTEQAVASAPVNVGIPNGNLTLASYSDNQTHASQAWTPVFFEIDCAVVFDLIHNEAKKIHLMLEGGIAAEYILPTFSNGSYTQAVGQDLERLNDNLNMSAVFIKLKSNFN